MDPTTTKYMIKAKFRTDGTVEKPDVVGAVFGQTEGLLGNELDMRDLQKSARIGRVEVIIETKKGKSEGTIEVPSALEKVETAIIAAALEAIDRVGPCKAQIRVDAIKDVRGSRRGQVIERAKELLQLIVEDDSAQSSNLMDEVRSAVQVAEVVRYGKDKLWAGPAVAKSEDVILVEGRNDVLNLLRCGVKNAISVEGTGVPDSIVELCKERVTTIFVDGDRGGEMIARELLQSCEIDFVARAPATREVEEIPFKLVQKALNGRMAASQYASQLGVTALGSSKSKSGAKATKKAEEKPARGRGRKSDDDKEDKPSRGRGRSRKADDDEDDKPKRGRGRGRKSDDDEEDDKPSRGRGRGRSRRDDDEDDEDDKPKRGRGRGRKSDDEEEDDKPSRGRGRGRSSDDDKPSRGRSRAKRDLAPELQAAREILDDIGGSLKAVILDQDGKELKKGIAVRELADTLRSSKDKIGSIVFDGVVTQRLLDIAAEKEIARVVGVKVGNVSKAPEGVEVVTKAELE